MVYNYISNGNVLPSHEIYEPHMCRPKSVATLQRKGVILKPQKGS